MKTSIKILLIVALGGLIVSFIQPSETDMARVYKQQGVPVFVLSEPLTPYTVTGKVDASDVVTWLDAATGTDTGRDLKGNIDVLINNANRKAKKGKFTFDGIITQDGQTGTCIKFNP